MKIIKFDFSKKLSVYSTQLPSKLLMLSTKQKPINIKLED